MNLNRSRPPKGLPVDQLDLWLSGVIHDAVRDAVEAGLPRRDAARLVEIIARQVRADTPLPEREVQP